MKRSPVRVAGLVAGVLACGAGAAWAQEVHKCTRDGHVTYQATPCAGDDKVLKLPGGPEQEQVELARQRADAQKAKAAGAPDKEASGAVRSRTGTRVAPELKV